MKRYFGASLLALAATGAAGAVSFEMVSLRSDGTPPAIYSDGSQQPAVSTDGRYVVFIGSSPTLTASGATGNQVYLRDRVLGTTELVSVSTSGAAANAASSVPSVSSDGCRVVFTSFATNLVPNDTNGRQDVFLRQRCGTPSTSLVSATPSGAPGNAGSVDGRISLDGTKVVFVSDATDLASAANSGFNCLFRRDLTTGVTSAITTAAGSCIVAGVPDLSSDGNRVVFWAYFAPGSSNTVNGVWQIYLYDYLGTAQSKPGLISTNVAGLGQLQGGEGISTVSAPAISADGTVVVFASRGIGLVPGADGLNYQVYVKQVASGAITRASVDSAGNPGNGNSSGGGQGFRPGVSLSGEIVTFLTSATNIAPEIGTYVSNVVAHVNSTGRTFGFTGAQTLNGVPGVSADGQLIVANSSYPLDTRFTTRGMFAFSPATLIDPPRLGNISARMHAGLGQNGLIAGFVIGGSISKTVAIVATGPSLAAFGITNALANPALTLVRSSDQTVIGTNDNWQSAPNAAQLQAAGFAPGNPLESAILTTLPPGGYTVLATGADGGTGVSVLAVYEVDHSEVPLVNISIRGEVLTGNDVIIGGFVVQGAAAQKVAIVATGPSLGAFGIANPLANPTLTLVRSSDQAVMAVNDDWASAANAAQLQAAGFAPTNPLESAILVTLPPGAYTAIVSGVGGTTGVAILGAYTVP